MHLHLHMCQMFPFAVVLGGAVIIIPPGFNTIITSRGNTVITSRSAASAIVIAIH